MPDFYICSNYPFNSECFIFDGDRQLTPDEMVELLRAGTRMNTTQCSRQALRSRFGRNPAPGIFSNFSQLSIWPGEVAERMYEKLALTWIADSVKAGRFFSSTIQDLGKFYAHVGRRIPGARSMTWLGDSVASGATTFESGLKKLGLPLAVLKGMQCGGGYWIMPVGVEVGKYFVAKTAKDGIKWVVKQAICKSNIVGWIAAELIAPYVTLDSIAKAAAIMTWEDEDTTALAFDPTKDIVQETIAAAHDVVDITLKNATTFFRPIEDYICETVASIIRGPVASKVQSITDEQGSAILAEEAFASMAGERHCFAGDSFQVVDSLTPELLLAETSIDVDAVQDVASKPAPKNLILTNKTEHTLPMKLRNHRYDGVPTLMGCSALLSTPETNGASTALAIPAMISSNLVSLPVLNEPAVLISWEERPIGLEGVLRCFRYRLKNGDGTTLQAEGQSHVSSSGKVLKTTLNGTLFNSNKSVMTHESRVITGDFATDVSTWKPPVASSVLTTAPIASRSIGFGAGSGTSSAFSSEKQVDDFLWKCAAEHAAGRELTRKYERTCVTDYSQTYLEGVQLTQHADEAIAGISMAHKSGSIDKKYRRLKDDFMRAAQRLEQANRVTNDRLAFGMYMKGCSREQAAADGHIDLALFKARMEYEKKYVVLHLYDLKFKLDDLNKKEVWGFTTSQLDLLFHAQARAIYSDYGSTLQEEMEKARPKRPYIFGLIGKKEIDVSIKQFFKAIGHMTEADYRLAAQDSTHPMRLASQAITNELRQRLINSKGFDPEAIAILRDYAVVVEKLGWPDRLVGEIRTDLLHAIPNVRSNAELDVIYRGIFAKEQEESHQRLVVQSHVLVEQAKTLFGAADLKGAKEKCLDALERNANCASAHWVLGCISFKQGDLDAAMAHYDTVRGIMDEAPPILGAMADVDFKKAIHFFEEKDFSSAREFCLKVIEKNNQKSEAYKLLGALDLAENQFERAVNQYSRAQSLNPCDTSLQGLIVSALNQHGAFLYQAGEVGEATRKWTASLAMNPDQEELHGFLADIALQKKNYSTTRAHCQRVERVEPDNKKETENLQKVERRRANFEAGQKPLTVSMGPSRTLEVIGVAASAVRLSLTMYSAISEHQARQERFSQLDQKIKIISDAPLVCYGLSPAASQVTLPKQPLSFREQQQSKFQNFKYGFSEVRREECQYH